MDITNLAFNIAALYTTCRDGYNFFTTMKKAETESLTQLRELEIQQSILKAWGFHWQIFSGYVLLEQPIKAEGVFSTLSALADTLSNQEKLTRRYGIQFHPAQAIQDGPELTNNVQLAIQDAKIEDVEPVISEVRNRLSILNKFKWALKDKNSFKKLIAELKSHSDSLYRLCPENAFESMNIYFIMECLSKQESPTDLEWISTFATEQAEVDKKSSVQQGYKLLASAATLKASVNENRSRREADDIALTNIDEEQPQMRNYASFDDSEEDIEPIKTVRPADPELRDLIRNFFNTFHGENMMGSVYGLDVAGMIDHTEGEHQGYCSILYKLLGMIGVQSRERPAENLKLRAPVTLQSLLGTRRKEGIRSTLGARFELARKLVRAVCLLHSSGWLHKNIRAESVMFFPEHVSVLQEDWYEVKTEIDVSKPVLMGYIFSRPDDIIIPINPPSAPSVPSAPRASRIVRYTAIGVDQPQRTRITRPLVGPTDETARLRRRKGTHRVAIYGRNVLEKEIVAERTKEANISGFILDYYQHPAKHADPTRQYRHAYDVYSLGILLLEVGLWEKLRDYENAPSEHSNEYDSDNSDYDEEDQYERRRWICREYLDHLRWECGDTYADAVLSCLMIDSSDDEMAKASERELCARVMADLEGCQA